MKNIVAPLFVVFSLISCAIPKPDTSPKNPANGNNECIGGGCSPNLSLTLYSDGHVTAENINTKMPKEPTPPKGDESLLDWLGGLFSPGSMTEKPITTGGNSGGSEGNGEGEGQGDGQGEGEGTVVDGDGQTTNPGNVDDPCMDNPTNCQQQPPKETHFEDSELGKLLSTTWKGLNIGFGELSGSNNKKRKEAQALNRRYAEMRDLEAQVNGLVDSINEGSGAVMGTVKDLSDGNKFNLTGDTFNQTKNFVFGHNNRMKNIDEDISDIPDPIAMPPAKPVYDTPDLKSVQQARQYRNYVSRQVENGPEAFKPIGRELVGFADNALDYSESAYKAGNKAEGDFAKHLAVSALDIALSLTPGIGLGKDIYEAASGKNLLTGEKLSTFERSMAFVGVLTAGYGSKLALLGKAAIITDIFKAGKGASEAAEVVRATGKAAEIVESAAKIGIKEKSVIDEIASAVKEGLPCKIALNQKPKLQDLIFGLLISTAYAADCIPNSAEKAVKDTLESFGQEGGKALPKMTPAQVSRSTKIDNTIRDHAKLSDFEGVAKELRGEKIPDGNGGFFDHITEMKESKAGLEKHSGALKDSLKNPNMDGDVRSFIQSQVNRADTTVTRMTDALAGKPNL